MLSPSKLIVCMALLINSGLIYASASSEREVYIISPDDGAVLSSPVTIQFGLRGMGVAPAGTDRANTGHHHLLVDFEGLPAAGKAMGSQVKHFGGGQTETSLELSPGQHTLQLIVGDKNHVPLQPTVVSERISITVK